MHSGEGNVYNGSTYRDEKSRANSNPSDETDDDGQNLRRILIGDRDESQWEAAQSTNATTHVGDWLRSTANSECNTALKTQDCPPAL